MHRRRKKWNFMFHLECPKITPCDFWNTPGRSLRILEASWTHPCDFRGNSKIHEILDFFGVMKKSWATSTFFPGNRFSHSTRPNWSYNLFLGPGSFSENSVDWALRFSRLSLMSSLSSRILSIRWLLIFSEAAEILFIRSPFGVSWKVQIESIIYH